MQEPSEHDLSKTAGRIPFRFRIGVTGHRDVEATDAVIRAVDGAIDDLCRSVEAASAGGVVLTIVSSLAPGADQIVAARVLQRTGATLEAVLPFELSKYRASLGADAGEFERLLARAKTVQTMPDPAAPEDGYWLAGRAVADRADALIALWDGHPARGTGGTAEIVQHARSRSDGDGRSACAVVVIDPAAPVRPTLTDEDRRRIGSITLDDANAYNEHALDRRSVAALQDEAEIASALLGDASHLGESARTLLQWIAPFYFRADSLALRAQRRYMRLGLAIVVASALALICAAIETVFQPTPEWPTWIELLALLVMIITVAVGRRRKYHGAWINNRFLAERFRSALFLASTGVGEQRTETALGEVPDEDNDWVRRAYSEVWGSRPDVVVPFEEMRTLAADRWVTNQVRYHEKSAVTHHLKLRISMDTIWILLITAIVVAGSHMFVEEHEDGSAVTSSHLLSLVSIVLPALGGAITAVVSQRDYERHHRRHERVARELSQLADAMRTASNAAALTTLVARAEGMMIAENRDWFGSVRFHDFEPHV